MFSFLYFRSFWYNSSANSKFFLIYLLIYFILDWFTFRDEFNRKGGVIYDRNTEKYGRIRSVYGMYTVVYDTVYGVRNSRPGWAQNLDFTCGAHFVWPRKMTDGKNTGTSWCIEKNRNHACFSIKSFHIDQKLDIHNPHIYHCY